MTDNLLSLFKFLLMHQLLKSREGVGYTVVAGDFITWSMFMTVTHKLKESDTAGELGLLSSAVMFISYI